MKFGPLPNSGSGLGFVKKKYTYYHLFLLMMLKILKYAKFVNFEFSSDLPKFALAPRKLVLDENTSEIQGSSYFCLKA